MDGIARSLASEGNTVTFARDEQGIVGVIALKDVVREETRQAIAELKAHGVHTIMLTGDSEKTASAIATEVALDEYHAECLPEKKLMRLNYLRSDLLPLQWLETVLMMHQHLLLLQLELLWVKGPT